MKTFHPRCRVVVIKSIKRRDIAPGLPVIADRYGKITGIDLTPLLGEMGGVRVSKSVRDPAGAFSITLADRAHPELLESLYALIEPQDLVEIRMARAPHEYVRDGDIPVVMRGLVSGVTRSETMSDRPGRTVTISGQDYGKVLQILQIFYLDNSVVGDNITHTFAFFQKYASGAQAIVKPAAEFVADVLEGVVNPYVAQMLALADGQAVGAQVIRAWRPDVTAVGAVSPNTVISFNNVTLHNLLATVLDVGPFNEMFVEDRADGVYLVVRPVPFKSPGGAYVQAGAAAESLAVDSVDLQSLTVSRSDAGVANYYWVGNDRWGLINNADQRRLATEGSPETFLLFDYFNSSIQQFGIRKMEISSNLGPPEYFNSYVKKEQMPVQTRSLGGWLAERRRVLAEMNRDNVIFEAGNCKLRGNERIRPGMYLLFRRGGRLDYAGEVYAYRVDHDFLPMRGFFTSVAFDRGTQFVTRAQRKEPPYFAEIDGAGVY